MAYVVDFTKDPNSLILGLINDNNIFIDKAL